MNRSSLRRRTLTTAEAQAALDRAVELGHEAQFHPNRLADGISKPKTGLTTRGWFLIVIVGALVVGGACAAINWVFPR